jgi:hypothetical protein
VGAGLVEAAFLGVAGGIGEIAGDAFGAAADGVAAPVQAVTSSAVNADARTMRLIGSP